MPDSIPWKKEAYTIFEYHAKKFLENFNTVSVTSLSAKTSFPLSHELFDIIIIDEASQCDIASAIPLVFRAKQLVIIGDPLQLKHISLITDFEETYIKERLNLFDKPYLRYNNKSLWDYSQNLLALLETPNNEPIFLDHHYRCHPQIIGYSNEAFYTKKIRKKLIIKTSDEQYKIKPKGIQWIDVKGKQEGKNINVNNDEVEKSIEIALQIVEKDSSVSIGIITPFRHQAQKINSKIPSRYRSQIIADTVHKFQGDEKDIIIYSLVVTDNSPSNKIKWIDYSVPNLVNVAVTRAKNTLYIVGNKEYIKNNSKTSKPLGKLVQYVERLNNG